MVKWLNVNTNKNLEINIQFLEGEKAVSMQSVKTHCNYYCYNLASNSVPNFWVAKVKVRLGQLPNSSYQKKQMNFHNLSCKL